MSGRFGRPDPTGRSSGKLGGKRGKLAKPPEGAAWVWLTADMVASDAWRSLSINARRFIDCLMLDNMAHAGTENGNLQATYEQLEVYGLSKNHITKAIQEAEDKGLVDSQRGGMRVTTRYRLTWLPDRDGCPATNRWERYKNSEIYPLNRDKLPPKEGAAGASVPPKKGADVTPQKGGPSISRGGNQNHLPKAAVAPSRDEEPKLAPNRPQIDLDSYDFESADDAHEAA